MSTPSETAVEQPFLPSRSVRTVVGIVFVCSIAALTAGYLFLYDHVQRLPDEKWNALSAIGQTLGAWATSVSFIVLIASLISQGRQLRLQQISLEAQFQELQYQRSALEQTASAVSAQLFLQLLHSAEKTLERELRALIQLSDPHDELDLGKLDEGSSRNSQFFADLLLSNRAVRSYAMDNATYNPIVHDVVLRYCASFDTLRLLADSAKIPVNLFDVVMDNSAHYRVYQTLKTALEPSSSSGRESSFQ